MLKVLLIDDEEFIREGLKSIIEWEKYNFKIVGEASDVYEGLKKIDSIKPDIIIANIKMPYMDGLTMTKRLQKISDDYNIIFLTTYSDFKFARKTIELGIYSYLLKPIDETELIEKLINLKDKILSTSRLMKNIITMTKEKYFENYILGVVSKDSIDQYSKILNLDFPWKSYQIALFEIEEYNNRNIKNRNLVKNKIKNEIDLFINKNQFGIIFNIEKYIGVLLKNEPFLISHKILINFKERICKKHDINLIISLGHIVKNHSDIIKSYNSSLEAINKKFFYGVNKIIKYNEFVEKSTGNICIQDICNYEKLYNFMDAGNREFVNNYLEKIRDFHEDLELNEDSIKIFYANLFTMLFNKIIVNYPEIKDKLENETSILEEIHNKNSLQSLHIYLKYYILLLTDKINNLKSGDTMEKIINYIDTNYNKNLKLDNLALLFNYNSVYLGRLFKSHTGEYFNRYLDTIRIKSAKKFILRGMKVNKIAREVGYKDIDYFYKKFKKYVGTSPTLYKKTRIK